jgi:hypothetical protein
VRRIAPTLRCGSNAILSPASPGGLARQASNRDVLFIELEQIERPRQFLPADLWIGSESRTQTSRRCSGRGELNGDDNTLAARGSPET